MKDWLRILGTLNGFAFVGAFFVFTLGCYVTLFFKVAYYLGKLFF